MKELLTNFKWGFDGSRQSMLIEGGRVIWRGSGEPPDAPDAATRDLSGRFLLPGFIDAHCHILPTGLDLQKLHLGTLSTQDDVLDAVRRRDRELPQGQWLHAVHYDQNRFDSARHLNRAQLDAISTDRPILLRHVNGHASVANSAALKAAGVDETTPDPKGGEYVRGDDGRLSGVLLETAHEQVSGASPMPSLEQMVDAILAAGEKMHELGITCASDMMTGFFNLEQELEAYRLAAERGCLIRMRLYLQWAIVFGPRAVASDRLRELLEALPADMCKVAGIKIFADGAIGSATAGIYGRFASGGGNYDAGRNTSGQLIYSAERLNEMVRVAHEAGYQIAIHSIGDYSTDLVMDAYEQLGDCSKHRIEHVMLLSDQQIQRLAKLNLFATMQPEFLMRLGHAYRQQLGEERASKLKRARSVLDAGIKLSFNSDRPIVAGDPWDGILTAERRPEGFDPGENVTRVEGLRSYTTAGAATNGDEDQGQLEPGQHADYQIFDTDPLTDPAPKAVETNCSGSRKLHYEKV
jgi:predicted amidohydrolase YtcJ